MCKTHYSDYLFDTCHFCMFSVFRISLSLSSLLCTLTHWHDRTLTSLIHIMTGHLFNTKLLLGPTLICCLFNCWKHTPLKFEWKFKIFSFNSIITFKMSSAKWWPFCLDHNMFNWYWFIIMKILHNILLWLFKIKVLHSGKSCWSCYQPWCIISLEMDIMRYCTYILMRYCIYILMIYCIYILIP